ncbi:hypothetical protein CO662_32915 [Rhizobium anhuiense]|uniref:SIS domain-containing protein n=1 Tax=Rhizobium anhuiense TaxID=1184720 RepID=A0ABX4IXU4_9HYPH|nr:hypothetical protein [Rhizobium anhuiense]PDS43440.1 hypothetical protein CO668_18760 [Rhizobium anhuiense]PDS47745.1 hypothetical protein CO662_32915 [Rhizobium anhuiense]
MFLTTDGKIGQEREERFKNLDVASVLDLDCRTVGRETGQGLLAIGYVVGSNHVFIGTGGDFAEFGLSVFQELDPDGKMATGCLWPARGSDPTTLFFEQEYFESEARHAPYAIVAISIANDYSLIQPLIRRVREMLPDAKLIVVAACASVQVHEQLKLQGVAMLAGLKRNATDINYWDLIARLDRRKLKIIPKMTHWLLNRMETRAALRDGYETAEKPIDDYSGDVQATNESLGTDEVEEDNPKYEDGSSDGRKPGPGR